MVVGSRARAHYSHLLMQFTLELKFVADHQFFYYDFRNRTMSASSSLRTIREVWADYLLIGVDDTKFQPLSSGELGWPTAKKRCYFFVKSSVLANSSKLIFAIFLLTSSGKSPSHTSVFEEFPANFFDELVL